VRRLFDEFYSSHFEKTKKREMINIDFITMMMEDANSISNGK
jgi:hypothetical protein